MPEPEQSIKEDTACRLQEYLKNLGDYGEPIYLAAGGSAAIYKVNYLEHCRVFKVYDPKFFSGTRVAAERRRLQIQRNLIGHQCSSLVQTYRVQEILGTAIIEMEFISWPRLTEKLEEIPDSAVSVLIRQLVSAVRFLESKGIIHRDIKPENIHISPDFKFLKLLDLGVAREFEIEESAIEANTDYGNHRPFLATAQYSSPEYLFRLDRPSCDFWKGLNFYQIGAVLHDLIMREPIFQYEMNLGNRWLLARAVLTKTPSFSENNPCRLASLKALAARCLIKDLTTRLQIVSWEDFDVDDTSNPLAGLKGRLAKCPNIKELEDGKLNSEKNDFITRFISQVKEKHIEVCGTKLPFSNSSVANTQSEFWFNFKKDERFSIQCNLSFKWGDELYCRTATISLSACLVAGDNLGKMEPDKSKAVCIAVIGESEEQAIFTVCNEIQKVIIHGIDIIDTSNNNLELNGVDLLSPAK